ncbi:hypothetical protein CLOLEP_00302 [[Clostridium] leptum DSM 753]|uniref:Uncharacterized protein n=1 Tax=[Clostridium] leptum DSM 753 TaxID=428125 RepID=A7VP25_9FIRM|nr:hypothetical protein CLOLEP_00302 [[Clostridium] leptum DSM 753]
MPTNRDFFQISEKKNGGWEISSNHDGKSLKNPKVMR